MSSPLASRVNTNAPSSLSGTRLAANAEARKLVLQSADSQPKPQASCLPQLVAERGVATPNAPALAAGAVMITYAQLNERANQLAHYLLSLDVIQSTSSDPDNIVGICLDRSITGTICALAVLKAGAAYLPLDPAYPVERLAFMLNDAQPRVLITSKAIAEQLPAGPWRVIAIDDAAWSEDKLRRQPTDSPDTKITPEKLAYVIYTSGSTGQPKGVEITHGSLMNLIVWHQRAFEVTPDDRASLLAGVGFDATVWETWPYLAAGASLHLPDEATRLSSEELDVLRQMAARRPDANEIVGYGFDFHLGFTPAHWSHYFQIHVWVTLNERTFPLAQGRGQT